MLQWWACWAPFNKLVCHKTRCCGCINYAGGCLKCSLSVLSYCPKVFTKLRKGFKRLFLTDCFLIKHCHSWQKLIWCNNKTECLLLFRWGSILSLRELDTMTKLNCNLIWTLLWSSTPKFSWHVPPNYNVNFLSSNDQRSRLNLVICQLLYNEWSISQGTHWDCALLWKAFFFSPTFLKWLPLIVSTFHSAKIKNWIIT